MKILRCIYGFVLIAVFGGFAYMHYYTVQHVRPVCVSLSETISRATIASDNDTTTTSTRSPVLANSPVTITETIKVIDLFNAMLSDNDRATTRVFALVTVLIAAAALIAALQFFVNHQMLKVLEVRSKKFEDEFIKKESKLSRLENAIKKVESLAQATSYPLCISKVNIYTEEFFKIKEYGKFIKHSFNGFDEDNRKDSADWNRILFFAQQAHASMENGSDELKDKIKRLIAVAACKSEECTGDREEKSILLSLAIDFFKLMDTKELCDKVNLASAYARRGMLYANLPDSDDYKQADQLFEKITREERFENQSDIQNDIMINCFLNWGISWLARASIFTQDSKKFGDHYLSDAKYKAAHYLGKANNIDPHIADYALLSLYSISKDKDKCETVISALEDRFKKPPFESLRLPNLHRIYEDIDLGFITEDKNLYNRLAKLAKDNEDRKDQEVL